MTDSERKYTQDALKALEAWLFLLPSDVQRKVKLAASVIESNGTATAEELSAELGGKNWVIARRTKSIIAKYGPDVVTITPKRYYSAQRAAIEKRF